MAINPMSKIIQHLHRTIALGDGAGQTDGQLLERYLNHREDAAFAVLVRRHGPMVMSVCRRVLGNDYDAEDAFQAAFLVLVRKAASVVPREMVANFLYGVAYTTAVRARGLIAKRRAKEKQVLKLPEPTTQPQALWSDVRPLLDRELSRLPDKYRVPIVLVDLEDMTIKEAARHLGWPQGTLAGRLARGRVMLAKRLSRRGLALSGGGLAVMLCQQVASASLPSRVVSCTIEAARVFAAGQAASGLISAPVAALTEGVLKTMLLTKLKTATAVVMLTALTLSAAGGLYKAVAGDAPQVEDVNSQPPSTSSQAKQRDVSVRLRRKPENYNEIFKNALEALEGLFQVAYANRYEGCIETANDLENVATMAPPVRRRAVVQFTTADDGGFLLHIQVHREVKVTKTKFDDKLSRDFMETNWEFIGRDIELEKVLLQRLVEQDRKESSRGPLPLSRWINMQPIS